MWAKSTKNLNTLQFMLIFFKIHPVIRQLTDNGRKRCLPAGNHKSEKNQFISKMHEFCA